MVGNSGPVCNEAKSLVASLLLSVPGSSIESVTIAITSQEVEDYGTEREMVSNSLLTEYTMSIKQGIL